MSDAGEGLIDADARIQERMEELEQARQQSRRRDVRDPEQLRAIESLRLAKTELQRQFEATLHEGRRAQIQQALGEVDRRIGEAQKLLV
jgi:hypothetical protein